MLTLRSFYFLSFVIDINHIEIVHADPLPGRESYGTGILRRFTKHCPVLENNRRPIHSTYTYVHNLRGSTFPSPEMTVSRMPTPLLPYW